MFGQVVPEILSHKPAGITNAMNTCAIPLIIGDENIQVTVY
jgi:hypothetical protein